MRVFFLALTLALASFHVATGQQTHSSSTQAKKATTGAHGDSESVTDSETRAIAKNLWESILVKCDDSYFYRADWGDYKKIIELKGITFGFKLGKNLTLADKENGVQKRVWALIGHKLKRSIDDDTPSAAKRWNAWSSWSDGEDIAALKRDISLIESDMGSPLLPPAGILMEKKNGQWMFYTHDFWANGFSSFDPNGHPKLSCSMFP